MAKTTYYEKVKHIEKLSKKESLDIFFDLIHAFRLVKSPIESALLIQDLLTATEIKHLAKRLRIAKLLLSGEKQRDIAYKLNCSHATIAKVNMWLNQGGDGLKNVISKLPKRYKMPEKLPQGPIEYYLPQVLMALTQYSLSKKQTKELEKFIQNIKIKKLMDKSLQETVDESYRLGRKKSKLL